MLTNRYLYEHAKFSFEFAKIIIGHDMTGDQKAKLVEIFQSLDKKVLAVGDGFNDINMVHQANVGFQIIDPKTKRTGYQFGDILVDNLVSIVLAMKRECQELEQQPAPDDTQHLQLLLSTGSRQSVLSDLLCRFRRKYSDLVLYLLLDVFHDSDGAGLHFHR
jgi:hypothetical protein